MKRIFFIILAVASSQIALAQKCFNVSLVALMNQVPKPDGSAAGNFGKCTVAKGSDGLQFIKDAGSNAVQLQNQIDQFNKDAITSVQQENSPANMDKKMKEAKDQANKGSNSNGSPQNMSQQQMMQQQTGYDPKKMDKPENLKLVMKAQQANMQIAMLVAQMNQKLTPLTLNLRQDLDKAMKGNYGDIGGCPHEDKSAGLPLCGCVTGILLKAQNAQVVAYNTYSQQAATIESNYASMVADQLAIIDQCILKLHNGDDLISSQYKQLLFSTQTSAMGTVGGTFLGLASSIITDSGKCYCQFVNISIDPPKHLGCAAN